MQNRNICIARQKPWSRIQINSDKILSFGTNQYFPEVYVKMITYVIVITRNFRGEKNHKFTIIFITWSEWLNDMSIVINRLTRMTWVWMILLSGANFFFSEVAVELITVAKVITYFRLSRYIRLPWIHIACKTV